MGKLDKQRKRLIPPSDPPDSSAAGSDFFKNWIRLEDRQTIVAASSDLTNPINPEINSSIIWVDSSPTEAVSASTKTVSTVDRSPSTALILKVKGKQIVRDRMKPNRFRMILSDSRVKELEISSEIPLSQELPVHIDAIRIINYQQDLRLRQKLLNDSKVSPVSLVSSIQGNVAVPAFVFTPSSLTTSDSENRIESSSSLAYDMSANLPQDTTSSKVGTPITDARSNDVNVVMTEVFVGSGVSKSPTNSISLIKSNTGDNPSVQTDPKFMSYAELIRKNNENENLKLEYIDSTISVEGNSRVRVSVEALNCSANVYKTHLFGYFLGTSMDYLVVRATFKRLWKQYGLVDVAKSPPGYFYFKFQNEKGLEEVLENGPWMVKQIPIFLNKWEPGLSLQKIEPSTIPLWVSFHDVPLELWTTKGISIIASGIGFPKLMDQTTQERCKNQTGRLGFIRVLIDVPASGNLPDVLEVEYPAFNGRPGKIIKLRVSYHWRPPVCSLCSVFGHSTKMCRKHTQPQSAPAVIPTNKATDTPPPVSNDFPVTKGVSTSAAKDSIKPPVTKKDEGFTTVVYNRKNGKKNFQWQIKGKSIVVDGGHSSRPSKPKITTKSPQTKSTSIASPPIPDNKPLANNPPTVVHKPTTKTKFVQSFNFARAVQGAGDKPLPKKKASTDDYMSEQSSQSKIKTRNRYDILGDDEDDAYDVYGSDSDDVYDPMDETSKFMERF